MRLTLAEPNYLKESISIISDLVNEARFKITPNAIEMVAMDPANVAMIIFKLLSSCFTEYNVTSEVEIGINLSNLKQILRRASSKDMLTLEMQDDKTLKIELRNGTIRKFNLPVIELEEKEQKVPDLKFPVLISAPSSVLNEAIADADVVAESVTLIAEHKKLFMNAEGDLSQVNIEISENESTKVSVGTNDKIKAKYSIEYLKKMINGSKLSDVVTIQFNNDYPLKLEYKSVDRLVLSFILAPRVEND